MSRGAGSTPVLGVVGAGTMGSGIAQKMAMEGFSVVLVDVNQGAFAFYGLRQLGPAADVTFGLRVNTLQDELTFKGPDVTRRQNKTWVDPIAGVTLRTPAGRVQGRLYTEIGGFGAGSDFTWQVFPTLSIRLAEKASLEFGYRWLDIDYAAGDGLDEFGYDMLTQGPVLGFGFRF